MTTIPTPSQMLQKLIRFNTSNPPGNEAACITYIASLLSELDIEHQIYYKDPGRPNLFARIRGQGSAAPLLLYGHVDVVTTANQEWEQDPFEGKIIDGVLWGRGAVDMKGGVAIMLSAFLKIKADNHDLPFDVIFLALSDEEVGGEFGAKYMVEEHPELFENVRFAIGEFGGFRMEIDGIDFYPIQVAEKEGCGLQIIVRGPAGHGSMVQRGGTMSKAAKLLDSLDRHQLPVHITGSTKLMFKGMAKHLSFFKRVLLRLSLFPTFTNVAFRLMGQKWKKFESLVRNTINVTLIEGGNAVNVLPSEVRMNADVRLLPGFSPKDVIAEIKRIYQGDAEFKVVYSSPNPAEKPDMGLYDLLSSCLEEENPKAIPIPFFMAGVTDARYFNRLGIQTYGFTPIELPNGVDYTELIHAPNERVIASSIDKGAEIIFKVITKYGGNEQGRLY